MKFQLMSLPFTKDALKPVISEETINYHYGKHHQGYVNKLNALTENTPLADKTLEELIKNEKGAIFNNAAQIWNHDFYWQCLSAQKNLAPQGKLLEVINKKWGTFDAFKKAFHDSALGNFGSGWTWLVKNADGSLDIVNTSNAGNPLTENKTPLLTCDVWEHAYYIDYRNDRGKYLDEFISAINWPFVEKRFG